MRYAVNEEGVQALKNLSNEVLESTESIKSAAQALKGAADDNASALGPHQASISNVLEEIQTAEQAAAEPVQEVSDKLNEVAEKYQGIIDDDPFSGMSVDSGN